MMYIGWLLGGIFGLWLVSVIAIGSVELREMREDEQERFKSR